MNSNIRIQIGRMLILILISFHANSCKSPINKIIRKYPNGTPGIINEYADKNDTSNYIAKEYYPNGKIHKIATVNNGHYVGNVMVYYSSGSIYQIDSLLRPRKVTDDDKWDADVTNFYENGKVSEKFEVRNGHIDGLSKYYNTRGVLVKEYYIIKDTIKNGEYREFYDNGMTLLLATYLNDTLVGTEYYFKENGDTIKYYNHYKGRPDFPYKKWLDNGDILFGNYAGNDDKVAVWTWYTKNGKLIKKENHRLKNEGFVAPE